MYPTAQITLSCRLVFPGFPRYLNTLPYLFSILLPLVPSSSTTEVTLSNSMLYQISHEKGISALTSWRNLLDVAKQISFRPFECTKLGKSTKKIQMIIMIQYVLIKQPFQYLLSTYFCAVRDNFYTSSIPKNINLIIIWTFLYWKNARLKARHFNFQTFEVLNFK